MNSQSIRFLFIAAVITSVAAQYLTIRSYTDAQCTKPTGGDFIKVYQSCAGLTSYENCTEGGGLYVKGSCGSTDPLSPLPKDVGIAINWADSITCNPSEDPYGRAYLNAYVATPGSCFMAETQVYKFDQCQDGKMTMRGFLDATECKTGGAEVDSDSGDDGVCRQKDTYSGKIYCPISSAPTAQTAPTTSAPKSGTTPAQAPIKSSYGVINASISSIMLLGASLVVLA